MNERCPRCGTPADAVAVTHHVPPGSVRTLRERLEIVRRELGLASDGEALAAAVRIVALDLNLGGRIGSADAGHTVRAIRPRRTEVEEHQEETGATGQQAEDAQHDDGGATAGSTGETGAPAETPGAADPEAEGGEPQTEAGATIDTGGGDADVVVNGGDAATPEAEQSDRTEDGETQTGADPQPE